MSRYAALFLLLAPCLVLLRLPDSPAQPAPKIKDIAEGRNGMVVTVSPPGTDVGLEILKKGGNAVDAAVAVGFAMAVTYPAAGNIGGGGFMVIHPPKGDPVV